MMVWVNKKPDGTTEMTGYDKGMKVLTRMVEDGDDWTITSRAGGEYQMKGAGCPDPIEFIFRLISPRNHEMNLDEKLPLLRFQSEESGELWEVWTVR